MTGTYPSQISCRIMGDRRANNKALGKTYDVLTDQAYGLKMASAPKVMADMVESLVGAIYIDTGCNLEPAFQVYCALPDTGALSARCQTAAYMKILLDYCLLLSAVIVKTAGISITISKRLHESQHKLLQLAITASTLSVCQKQEFSLSVRCLTESWTPSLSQKQFPFIPSECSWRRHLEEVSS